MSRPAIHFHDLAPMTADLYQEVVRGLSADPKVIAPKFFYDRRGSELFDAICELPEYYPTRTEIGILQQHAREIAGQVGQRCLLIELGSGASRKVRLLLDALRPAAYLGIDISRDFLLSATRRLAADYPWLAVHATCADFCQALALEHCPEGLRRMAFFPGSSIGNFEPVQAQAFLERLRSLLEPDGALLIGVDVQKNPALLNAAYNDSAGLTAAFNRNLLVRIRRELNAVLDPDGFAHQAFYNAAAGRIEMHLVSQGRQTIRIGQQIFRFQDGETLHTENSYKYTVASFQDLARRAGYRPRAVWTDAAGLFSVHYLELA